MCHGRSEIPSTTSSGFTSASTEVAAEGRLGPVAVVGQLGRCRVNAFVGEQRRGRRRVLVEVLQADRPMLARRRSSPTTTGRHRARTAGAAASMSADTWAISSSENTPVRCRNPASPRKWAGPRDRCRDRSCARGRGARRPGHGSRSSRRCGPAGGRAAIAARPTSRGRRRAGPAPVEGSAGEESHRRVDVVDEIGQLLLVEADDRTGVGAAGSYRQPVIEQRERPAVAPHHEGQRSRPQLARTGFGQPAVVRDAGGQLVVEEGDGRRRSRCRRHASSAGRASTS